MVLAVVIQVLVSMIQREKLPLNGLVGIRTSATRHCEKCWTVGHRAALPVLRLTVLVAVLVAVVTGVLVVWAPWGAGGVDLVAGISEVVGYSLVLGLVVWGAVVAHRAARAVHR